MTKRNNICNIKVKISYIKEQQSEETEFIGLKNDFHIQVKNTIIHSSV